jgi:hypothetical protein
MRDKAIQSRQVIKFLGVYLIAAGISGTIDRLAHQPIMSPVLNFFNRIVIPHVSFLNGFEIFANLTLAAMGGIVVVIAARLKME